MLSLASSFERAWRCAGWLVLAAGMTLVAARAQPADLDGTMPEDIFPGLKRILESALQQAPVMLEKQLDLTLSEVKVIATDAARWPRLGGSVRYDNSQASISGGGSSRSDRGSGLFGGVDATQPIFHWGALKNESARARIGVAVAEKNYQEIYRLLAIELRRRFLYLVARKAELVQVRDRQRLNLAELNATVERRTRGLASEGDVTARQIALEEYALELERREVEFASLRRTLGRLAGAGEVKEEEIPADIPEVAYAPQLTARLLAAVLRDGAQNSFEVQGFGLQVREADLSYRIANVRLLPKFNAGAGYALENTTSATTNSVSQQGIERQSFGIRADWSIFDGFATRAAKREAFTMKRLAERKLAAAVERVQEEAQLAAKQVELEATAVKLTDRRRLLSVSQVKRTEEEFALGNQSKSDIEVAQLEAYRTQAASVFARASLLTRWSEFVSTVGVDPMLKNLPLRHAPQKR